MHAALPRPVPVCPPMRRPEFVMAALLLPAHLPSPQSSVLSARPLAPSSSPMDHGCLRCRLHSRNHGAHCPARSPGSRARPSLPPPSLLRRPSLARRFPRVGSPAVSESPQAVKTSPVPAQTKTLNSLTRTHCCLHTCPHHRPLSLSLSLPLRTLPLPSLEPSAPAPIVAPRRDRHCACPACTAAPPRLR